MWAKKLKNNLITDIVQQKNQADRFSVYIDNEFAFGICDFDLYTLKLKVGDVIDDDQRQLIDEVIDVEKCKKYATGLVSKKMYSKKEIFDKLKQKGFSLTSVSGVISILEEYGYVNDDYYASLYIENYLKKYGIHKIRFNLLQKGIDADIIEKKLENFKNDQYLEEMIKKKIGDKEINREMYAKIVRSFASKGFEFDKIKACLLKIAGEVDDFE